MRTSTRVSRTAFWIVITLLLVAIILLAKANALTFPFPSDDDAAFFIPAWNLAVHGNLKPEALNAPNGIYWVPHGYYLWLATFLSLFGPTVEVARTISQVTTAAAIALLTWAHARISRSLFFGALCAFLLVSPVVIIVANMIRMDSLIFLLYSIAILLHTYRRYLLAAAVLCLSLLVHPALMFSTALYLASVAFLYREQKSNPDREGPRWVGASEIVIGALVLAAISAEAILVLRHIELFRQHMAFQAQRKAARSLFMVLSSKGGILLVTETVLVAFGALALRKGICSQHGILLDLGPLVLAALGLQAYAAFGYEWPYGIYSFAVIPATLLCITYGAASLMSSDLAGKTL